MKKAHTVAGILSLAAGVLGLGLVVWLFAYAESIGAQHWQYVDPSDVIIPEGVVQGSLIMTLQSLAVLTSPFAVLSVIGAIFSLRRRKWGLALAGSIAAVMPFFPLGIPAIIFTAPSRKEFKRAR